MKYTMIGVLLLLSFTSCTFRESAPELTGAQIPAAKIAQELSTFDSHRDQVRDIKALIRVKMTRGNETQSYRYAVVYRRPDSLRLEVFPLNSFYTLSLLAVLREKLVSLDTSASIAYVGTPSREAIERAFGMPLSIEEISSLLLAEIPPTKVGFTGVRDENSTLERYLSLDSKIYFEKKFQSVNIETLRLYDESKKLIIEARFKSYKVVSGVSLPDKIEIRLPQYDVIGEMSFSSTSINTDPLDSLFSVEAPTDYNIRSIE